jgi:hypothetical protein
MALDLICREFGSGGRNALTGITTGRTYLRYSKRKVKNSEDHGISNAGLPLLF